MPRVSTYLNFPGNTEEAFNFYRSVFGGEFTHVARFGEMPPSAGCPPLPEEAQHLILHIELPLPGGHVIMATDSPECLGMAVRPGNHMHINLEPDTRGETGRLFQALSEGGTVSMPLQDMFWGAYFASFTDRFGINWMLNCASQH